MTFPRGGAHDPGDSPETEADRSARVARERAMLDDARREYEQGLGLTGDRARAFLYGLAARRGPRRYALTVELDPPFAATDDDIAAILREHGFERRQGSVYFGDASVDPVRCVLAVQDVAARCAWFRLAAKGVRMLRIEENNDLMPAIEGPGRPAAAE